MKIEIAESLASSWLRHARGCLVTQTNWKPSPSWPLRKGHELRAAFDQVRASAIESIGAGIFKQGGFDQFIRQAEVDVLGLRLPPERGQRTVIAVDTAFHESGLNYGSADETVGRVLKKLIRAAFALDAYIDFDEAEVVFATPRMAEPIQRRIEDHLEKVEVLLARQDAWSTSRLSFRIIANQAFSGEILTPVLEQADTVADTSELFMRARQLLNLCDALPSGRVRNNHPAPADPRQAAKIGQHVQRTMEELATTACLDDAIVGQLLDARYCKATLNLGLPFLKAVEPGIELSVQRIDEKGYGRYWKRPLRVGNRDFLMCSQWFEWQRPAFERWARRFGSGTPRDEGAR